MLERMLRAYHRWFWRSHRLTRSVVAGFLFGLVMIPFGLLVGGPPDRIWLIILGACSLFFTCGVYWFIPNRRSTGKGEAPRGGTDEEEPSSHELMDLLGKEREGPNEGNNDKGERA